MKKLIALLLTIAMVLALFAGCGSKGETTGDNQTETQTGTEATGDNRLPLVPAGEKKTLSIGVQQSVNVVDYDTNDFTLWLEEKTGVDLEFYYFSSNSSEAKQQLSLMMAGGETLPDILWNFDGISLVSAQELGSDGYLVDIKPYFGKYSPFFDEACSKLSHPEDANEMIVRGTDPDEGTMYGFPTYGRTVGIDTTTNHIMINTKWLEAVGETMPKTPEDLRRVLEKFRDNDPNGNGLKDELPMVGSVSVSRSNVLEWLLCAYIYVNDNYLFNVDDGKLSYPQITDEYRQGLIFLHDLYADGLISPLVFSVKSYGEMKELNTPSTGDEIVGVSGGHVMLNHNEGSELIFDYQMMPTLDAGTGKGGYRSCEDASYSYKSFITEDCDDPILAFRFLDFMSGEDAFLYARFGLQGRDWDWAEEGMLDQFGEPAVLNILDSSIFSSQNNVNWHSHGAIYDSAVYPFYSMPADEAVEYEARLELWYDKCLEDFIAVETKPEVLLGMVWPSSKNEQRADLSKQIWPYIEEARALFVTGEMDPRSDADWQTYLDSLKTMGADEMLELYQENYTRTHQD